VHEGAVLLERERVVEVPCRLRVDGEREPVAKVDPPLHIELRRRVPLESPQLAFLDEQPFEHDLDRARRPQHALDFGTTAASADDRQVAGPPLPLALQ
jgi:hypothetical protein